MKRKYLAMLAAVAMFLTPQVANAGSTTLTNAKNGQSVSIHCTGSGCSITIFNNSGAVIGNRSGPGGTANFNKQVAKYKRKGFK